MKKNPSLEFRLISGIAGLYAAALILFTLAFLVIGWTTHQIEIQDITDDLVENLSDALIQNSDGTVGIDPGSAINDRLKEIPDLAFTIDSIKTGSRLLSYGTLDPAILVLDKTWKFSGQFKARSGQVRIISVQNRHTKIGRVRIVLIRGGVRNSDLIAWVIDEMWDETIPVIMPLFLVSIAAIWFIVRRGMQPLRKVSGEADSIGHSPDSEIRLSTENVPAEILTLVSAANGAFDRIEGMLKRQRRFTANAAHELRTPLAILRTGIDSLTEGKAHEQLAAEADRLARRVNQLMAMARLESSALDLDRIPDLGKLVGTVVARMVPLARKRHRDIVFHAPAEPIEVLGNAPLLEEAILNLVENSLRFTDINTHVDISVTKEGEISVRDFGPGVVNSDLEKIFEPFWRGSTQIGDGAGLGLAIVKETAIRHGGEISAMNNGDRGMTFSLRLKPEN
jgi:signal transduction histidine kinase